MVIIRLFQYFSMVAHLLKNPVCRNLFNATRCLHLSKVILSWEMPEGYATPVKLHNQEAKKNVPLVLRNEGVASWYMCGPTVYDDAHIGHASSYVKFDIIRRIMENVFKIKVVSVMGVTDIDDKIIQKARQMNVSPQLITRKYEASFLSDMESLNVLLPTKISRVTENIPLIISFCECLISKDFAYVTSEGNVYFMVSKVEAKSTEDVETEELSSIDPLKRDVRDFALWKRAKLGEPSWESPWGRGRPGWHIECSAMASSAFGSFLDIHSGGMDLRFPHHANEQSQSEAFHGTKPWVNYWLHAGLLHIPGGDKMSKSLGNIITIKQFLDKNNVNDFRILCLQSPYQNSIHYTQETLNGAKGLHKTFHNFLNDVEACVEGNMHFELTSEEDLLSKLAETKCLVESAFSDDFNTSRALLCLIDFIGVINKCLQPSLDADVLKSMKVVAACASYVDKTLEILGVNIMCKKRLPRIFVYAVDAIVNFRNGIRTCALKKVKNQANMKTASSKETETFTKSMESLKISLLAIGVDIEACDLNSPFESGKLKYSHCTSDQMVYENLNQGLKALLSFIAEVQTSMYKENEEISSVTDVSEPSPTLASERGEGLKPSELKEKKSKTKATEFQLLKACDSFRTKLNDAKITVKDKGEISYWSPMEDFCS